MLCKSVEGLISFTLSNNVFSFLFRTAEKATVQPSLGPLAMAVCQRSLQCARLVTAICSSDITGEQKEKYQEVRLRWRL